MEATALLRTTIESGPGGRLHIQAIITSASTQRNRQVIDVDAASETNLISALNSLVRQINAASVNFSTSNTRALQAFTAAANTSNLQTRIDQLSSAVSLDPHFGLAYMLLLNTVAATGGHNVEGVISQVANRRNNFTPIDRARLREIIARLQHAGLAEKENAAEAVLKLVPNDVDTLVALGVDRFLQGDADGGRRSLERALELSPGNESIRQDLAHGLIQTRHYKDAEKLITNPADLAVCLLLQGNASQANATIDKVVGSMNNADLKVLFRANWLAISGELEKAIEAVEDATFANRATQSAGLVQIAFWQSMERDFAGAKKSAARACELNGTRGSLATVAQLLTEAQKPPAEWRREVELARLDPVSSRTLLGYGFFLYGRYPEAAEVWRQILDQSGDTDLHARAMLAASLDKAGRSGDARKIRVQPFIPEFGDLYAPISFNQMRRLIQ
jgi:tetratricopeptide (TPR) repeat protein